MFFDIVECITKTNLGWDGMDCLSLSLLCMKDIAYYAATKLPCNRCRIHAG